MKKENSEEKCVMYYIKESIHNDVDNPYLICDIYLKITEDRWEGFSASVKNKTIESIMRFDSIEIFHENISVEQSLEDAGYTKAELSSNNLYKDNIILAECCIEEHLSRAIQEVEKKPLIEIKTHACFVSIKFSKDSKNQYDEALAKILNGIDHKADKQSILNKFLENIKEQDLDMLQVLFVYMQSAQEGKTVKYVTENDEEIRPPDINQLNSLIQVIREERFFSYGHKGNTRSWQSLMRSLKTVILNKLQNSTPKGKNHLIFNQEMQLFAQRGLGYQQLGFHTSRIRLVTWGKTDTQCKYDNFNSVEVDNRVVLPIPNSTGVDREVDTRVALSIRGK